MPPKKIARAMENDAPDEETALLAPSSCSRDVETHKAPTPLPKFQLFLVVLIQLTEPMSSQCIYPFINQLIRDLDITGGDEHKVGYYAGLIESLFFASEAVTVLQWSRLSDHVGRKPVVLVGLAGIFLSMLSFGLSRTFMGLVISRCLCGMLNGNVGVMKSLMAEMADASNIAQVFALFPVTWSVGATLGPFIGGSLSRPHERFPRYFGGQFWQTYPYFLACAASALGSAIAFVFVFLFLKETLHRRKGPAKFDDQGVDGRGGGPALALDPGRTAEDRVALRELLVYPVLISIMNYVLLAFLDIAKCALLPLFLSTPIEVGGLGLSPPTIGLILGLNGLGNGIFQGLLCARAIRRWGPKRVFCQGIGAFLVVFGLFPVMSLLARSGGLTARVWAALGVQIIMTMVVDTSYACVFMFVTSSAPNRRSLGATNGLSQTAVSIARATGPALSTSLFAFSVEHELLGGYAVYGVMGGMTCFSLLFAMQLPERADCV